MNERERAHKVLDEILTELGVDIPFNGQLTFAEAGLDSFALVLVAVAIEEASEEPVSDEELEGCTTLGDIVSLLERRFANNVAPGSES